MKNNKFITFILAVFILISSGCATTQRKAVVGDQEFILKDVCEASYIQLQWDSVSRVVTLTFQDRTAKFLVGSEVVLLNGQRVYLTKATRVERSEIIVPVDFKAKIIEKLKPPIVVQHSDRSSSTGRSTRYIREVIIDAGHGGKDPGALGRVGTREKDIVLDIARRLKRLLEREGIKVRMTRSKDEFISLQERTEVACRSDADLFVSIHANSSPVRAVSGIEVYSLKDLNYMEKNETQRKSNLKMTFHHLAMKRNSDDLEAIVSDMLYIYKQAESSLLARQISHNVPELARNKSRGVKEARFYVLRNTMIPSILIETGFLTNPQEERSLRTPMYREKLARAIAITVTKYVRSKR